MWLIKDLCVVMLLTQPQIWSERYRKFSRSAERAEFVSWVSNKDTLTIELIMTIPTETDLYPKLFKIYLYVS